jgi:hypothetical protein
MNEQIYSSYTHLCVMKTIIMYNEDDDDDITHTHIHTYTPHTINHSVGHTHRHSTIAYHHTLRTYLIMFQYGGAVRLIGG